MPQACARKLWRSARIYRVPGRSSPSRWLLARGVQEREGLPRPRSNRRGVAPLTMEVFMAKTFGLMALLRRNDRILKAAIAGTVVYGLTIAAVSPAITAASAGTVVMA